MTEVTKLSKEAEINSLLLPLLDRQLLLPAVTIAEMIPFQAPQKDDDSFPDWYLGDIGWRQLRIPVVSYEVMSGDRMPPSGLSCRIAVLNNTGVSERLSFVGLLTQGIPRLSRVGADEVHEVKDAATKTFDLMHVTHAGEQLIIPDVSAMQQAVLDLILSLQP